MLTIFTIPKAFRGHFAIIQENALASWTKIRPQCEIILFGDDNGVQHIAKKYRVKHIPDVKKNEEGTPILSDIFNKAQKASQNKILCYVNADIILPSDFVRVVTKVPFKKFLISGRRRNLEIKKRLGFSKDWFDDLKSEAVKNSKLDQPGALDYFIFPKSVDFKMPPFAVGRGVWDNWLIYKAKLLKILVIDATEVIFAIHQNHDYSHAVGFQAVWFGEERQQNLKLAKDKKRPFNLVNADRVLTRQGIKNPPISLFRLWRHMQVFPVINPQTNIFTLPPILIVEFLIKGYRKIKNYL